MLTPHQIICIPSERNANGSIDIIMSSREGKVFQCTEADDRDAWEAATSHSMPAGQLFPWEELPRSPSRVEVLKWYIDIANEKNLSLVDITLFPMVVDHGSFTVCTSVCNMWSSYIDRLKVEANKGRSKCVNPTMVRCMQIINHLVRNYLNSGDNVECYDSWPRKRVRMNNASLVPKTVFIESSINSSSEEIPSFTSSVLQVPEFGEHKCKDSVVIVKLWSVFDGAFLDVKIKTKSAQVVDGHQRMMKVWEAWGT